MKRIGVITYFYYYNYGTMLQGYALCKFVNRLGHNQVQTELIDCRFKETELTKKQLFLIRLKRLWVYIIQFQGVYKLAKYKKKASLREPLFDAFAKNFCPLTPRTYSTSVDLAKCPPDYDIYITGSDQTWSPKIGLKDSLFLGFALDNRIRASYAPSIGVVSYTEEQKKYVKERLARYQFISCREKYGADVLQELAPVKVETVLDPTLVINAEEWREIETSSIVEGDYILCYFIGDKDYYRYYAKQLSQQLNLPLVYIPVSYKDFSSRNKLLWKTGPREFLSLIDHAKVVLTDSFHGTIFSINFNKQFYSFTKHAGIHSMDNMRIVDILDRMNLRNRLVLSYTKGTPIEFTLIDYAQTNHLLDLERQKSEMFLKTVLDSAR